MIAGAALASVLLLLFMRTIYVLLVKSSTLPGRRAPARTMVVLGSGQAYGSTRERITQHRPQILRILAACRRTACPIQVLLAVQVVIQLRC